MGLFFLLGKYLELGSRCEVRAVLAGQCREAEIAGALWIGEHYFLLLRRCIEVATGQIDEAFDEFLLAAVEIHPVGILRHGDAVHGVPNGAWVAIDKVLAVVAARTFLTTYIDHLDGHILDALECLRRRPVSVACIACIDGSAVAQIEGPCVFLLLAFAYLVADGQVLEVARRVAYNGDFADFVSQDDEWEERHAVHLCAGREVVACRDWSDDEHHLVESTDDSVFLQRSALSAAIAAEAVHLAVEVEVGAVGSR